MRFWDSSAIIPLLVPENETEKVALLKEEDPHLVVWALTVTEILSAIYRKIRLGEIQEGLLTQIRSRLDLLQGGWSEVIQIEGVRAKANRLLAVHPLRAADSLQLAAALIAFEDQPAGEHFVTFDENLKKAAEREGFTVL